MVVWSGSLLLHNYFKFAFWSCGTLGLSQASDPQISPYNYTSQLVLLEWSTTPILGLEGHNATQAWVNMNQQKQKPKQKQKQKQKQQEQKLSRNMNDLNRTQAESEAKSANNRNGHTIL